ncbi:TPA: YjbQ family protein [Candidatus Poribacteria bacterium]|nr:YjbQ family protein [Candidatus Poribacteria bacterium]
MIYQIEIITRTQTEFVNVTSQIQELVGQSEVNEGICYLYVPHTTAAVTINESADRNVVKDIIFTLNKVIPFEDKYRHLEGNSAAHIKASIIGPSETIPVENGRLMLGTWQGIFFGEFDGPKRRKMLVKIVAC